MADPVTDFLAQPDQFGQPAKRPTLTLPKKGAAAANDPVSQFLSDPDSPPPPPVVPKETVSPEGGGMDYLYGGLQGAYNTVRGLGMGALGQAFGLADIPVHAFGKATGLYDAPDPETVQGAVSDAFRMTPSTRTGERFGQLVEEGAGDILGVPGDVAAAGEKVLTENTGKPTEGVGFMQAQTGIKPGPGEPHQQSDYEKGIAQSVGNAFAMLAGGRGAANVSRRTPPPSGGTPSIEPGLEEPPPSQADPEFQNIHGKDEYAAPAPKEGEAPASPKADTVRETPATPPKKRAQKPLQAPKDVSRLLAGTNAKVEPFKTDQTPSDIQWNSVELEPGLGDVRLPQRNRYAGPSAEFLQKLGESQYGFAIRGEKFRLDPAILQQFREYGQRGEWPWWQEGGKGMLANIAHAVDIASERRQIRQKAYRTMADEVGTREMLKNAPDYALTFDWTKDEDIPKKTEVVCDF